ncbi:MAG: FHA domain-containing protein [Vicinamibacterales bacterium]
MIRKLVIGNGRSEREILLVGNITIGRDPSCHVSDPDPLLSRRHAEIIANVHGVSVRDLDSRNGVLVNGEKTREQVLMPGDLVQMGHLQLRYIEEQPRQGDPAATRPTEPRRPSPPSSYDIDRFRPDPPQVPRPSSQVTPQPGRWKPEPTPLPGRRSSAPPPPSSFTPRPPTPRGRAAFDETARTPRPGPLPGQLDQTRLASTHDTTIGGPADLDATVLASDIGQHDDGRWDDTNDPDATMLAADAGYNPDSTAVPGDATFAAALSHLAGLAGPGQEGTPAAGTHRLSANAELIITSVSPGCAELLGVPDEDLVGDSLADVFLRGVRRAYAEPDLALNLSVSRGPRGSIAVTLMLGKISGHE